MWVPYFIYNIFSAFCNNEFGWIDSFRLWLMDHGTFDIWRCHNNDIVPMNIIIIIVYYLLLWLLLLLFCSNLFYSLNLILFYCLDVGCRLSAAWLSFESNSNFLNDELERARIVITFWSMFLWEFCVCTQNLKHRSKVK